MRSDPARHCIYIRSQLMPQASNIDVDVCLHYTFKMRKLTGLRIERRDVSVFVSRNNNGIGGMRNDTIDL